MLLPDSQILCVEDHEDLGQGLKSFLDSKGHQVTIAPSVTRALEFAKASRFSLYILDYHLPDGTGIELCHLIRAFDLSTPILLYSHSADPQLRQLALSAGAQSCLRKTVAPEVLVATVQQLIRITPCVPSVASSVHLPIS